MSTKPGNRAGKGCARRAGAAVCVRQRCGCVRREASASVGGMYTPSFHDAALAARHVRH